MLPNTDILGNVAVTFSPVPSSLVGATSRGVLWQASQGHFLLDLPGVARYLVEGGRTVTVESATEISHDTVAAFFRMTPLAALLYQRNMLALHTAVVTNGNGAILLAGDSGCGKSALMLALQRRGWVPLSDEIAALSLNDDGSLSVHPTFAVNALWPETLKRFGLDTDSYRSTDANRLLVPFPEQQNNSSLFIRSIYWLGVQNKFEITRLALNGVDLFKGVGMLLYNSQIASAILDRVTYMRYVSTMIKLVPIIRICRPRGLWSIDELTDLIQKDMA